jgi:hypothetical protein
MHLRTAMTPAATAKMAKRRRRKMSEGKQTFEQGVPIEKIKEAMASFPSCRLTVKRRNDKGQLGTVCAHVAMPLEQLLQVDGWLQSNFGGGAYRCEPFNPNGAEPLYAVTPFQVLIEGPPLPARRVPAMAPSGVDPAGGFALPTVQQQPMMGPLQPGNFGPTIPQYGPIPGSGWAGGLNPEYANAFIQAGNQMYGAPPGFGAYVRPAKDAMVNNPVYDNVVANMRGELERERAKGQAALDKYEDLRRDFDRKLELERKEWDKERRHLEDTHKRELETLKKEHDRDQREHERERQDLRDRSLRAEMGAQPKGPDYAGLLVGLAPVMSAYISSSSERDRVQQAQQLEMMRLQMESQKKGKGEDQTLEFIKTLAPLAVPLIGKAMESKSPDAIVALLEAYQNNQMQNLGMTMQLIEQMTPEEKPLWAQVLLEALSQMQDVGGKIINGLKGNQDHAQPQQLPPPTVRSTQPQQTQRAQQPSVQSIDPVADEIDKQLMPQLPQSFQTLEWRNIVVALRKKIPAEALSKMLADHFAFLITNNIVPEELGDFVNEPVDGLDSLVRPLVPIFQLDPEYVRDIMLRTLILLHEQDLIDWAPPDEDEESENGAGSETLNNAMGDADKRELVGVDAE